MKELFLTAILVSLAGFIIGLAGKAWAVKQKSLQKNQFFSRVSILFLILMFLLVIFYQFIL